MRQRTRGVARAARLGAASVMSALIAVGCGVASGSLATAGSAAPAAPLPERSERLRSQAAATTVGDLSVVPDPAPPTAGDIACGEALSPQGGCAGCGICFGALHYCCADKKIVGVCPSFVSIMSSASCPK